MIIPSNNIFRRTSNLAFGSSERKGEALDLHVKAEMVDSRSVEASKINALRTLRLARDAMNDANA